MIGVPSIALAAVSLLFVALWHQKRNNLWLVLSGFALALSVLIKLFTGLLAPIFLVGITASVYFESRTDWLFVEDASAGVDLGHLFRQPGTPAGIGADRSPKRVVDHLPAYYRADDRVAPRGGVHHQYPSPGCGPVVVAGSLWGPCSSIYRRNWLTLYPLAWAVLAYTLFSFYSPVFYHHQLMVTDPGSDAGCYR